MKELCDIPINRPDNTRMMVKKGMNSDTSAINPPLIPARRVRVRSEAFAFIWELARAIVEGSDWNKKARIVLEYDPNAEKMPITVFREYR